MPRLTSLSGAQVAVLFDDPLGIVEFDEVADGVPQLRDVAVDATMDDLFLQRAIEPLGDAVGLGLGDEGVGRLDAPELDLVGEVVRQILGAVIHGRRQAMRIEREREILKTGKSSIEVTWSLTSLGTDRAGPEELLALVRNHWHIENRLHYVRDFTYDEDRCRAYVRHLPRNLACLTNVAIAIVRCSGRFRYLPEANRHYAARAQDALDAILIAPTA